MPDVVVDTDVVSYLFKKDTRGRLYRRHLLGNDLVVSFMTLAELEHWALCWGWGLAARERLQRFLQPYRVYDTDPGLNS